MVELLLWRMLHRGRFCIASASCICVNVEHSSTEMCAFSFWIQQHTEAFQLLHERLANQTLIAGKYQASRPWILLEGALYVVLPIATVAFLSRFCSNIYI